MRIGIGVVVTKYVDGEVKGKPLVNVFDNWFTAKTYINSVSREYNRLYPKRNVVSTFELLGRNKTLYNEIVKFREQFKIPAKYSFKNYILQALPIKDKALKAKAEEYFECLKNNFVMPDYLAIDNLKELFYTGVISKTPDKHADYIFISRRKEEEMTDIKVSINICSKSVKRNTLNDFIKRRWDKLEAEIETLPDLSFPKASERDLFAYDLKEQGKTYDEITNAIVKKYGEGRDEVNKGDTVHKTAYARTKKLIESMFYKKETSN